MFDPFVFKKNLLWFVLSFVCLSIVLVGCGQNEIVETTVETTIATTEYIQITSPPALNIVCGNEMTTAQIGTYSWQYSDVDNVDRGKGIEADSFHPLNPRSQEYMPLVMATENQLTFEFGIPPDSYFVRYWSDVHIGDEENNYYNYEEVVIDGYTVPLPQESGGYVYQVNAAWTSADRYGGSAWYTFIVQIE